MAVYNTFEKVCETIRDDFGLTGKKSNLKTVDGFDLPEVKII